MALYVVFINDCGFGIYRIATMKSILDKEIADFMKKYTHRTVEKREYEDVHWVWLDIDQQHFKLSTDCETEKQAKWYQRQLAIALFRFLKRDKEF